MYRILCGFFLATFLLSSSSLTLAQYGLRGSTDGLTATGSHEIAVRPDLLQMTIQVEGRSSDLPQAAGELKRRVAIAREKLEKLSARDVTVAKPKLQGSSSPQQAQQMQAMMQQYGGGQRGQQMLEKTVSVSLVQTITARWPLAGSDDIDRLISTKKLTQAIKDADIASTADKQPVSPAQEELAVEMQAMIDEYSYGEEQSKVGEPEFQFVATIPADQYRQSVTTAFAQAKRKIKTLADACGVAISEPLPVSSAMGSATQEDYYGGRVGTEPSEDSETGDFEWLANDPIEATCTVTVTAVSRHQP